MAKQKPGVYDRVLECAKEEFLSKGFLDASLRTIAQEAGTSTGSIYTRFGDKEGLFRAIDVYKRQRSSRAWWEKFPLRRRRYAECDHPGRLRERRPAGTL